MANAEIEIENKKELSHKRYFFWWFWIKTKLKEAIEGQLMVPASAVIPSSKEKIIVDVIKKFVVGN